MTVRITSRPRIGDVIERIWPGQVIGDSVCMQPPILSTFSFESGFHFDSRGELYRRAVALRRRLAGSGSGISHVCPKRRISRMIGSSARPLSVSS